MKAIWAVLLGACAGWPAAADDGLAEGWANPPVTARLRAYWWWLNGNVTKAAITRDLEQMKAKGFGGALICDAGGAEQDGNDPVPHGPTFFTPQWRELFKHTLREADRLGLEMSLNIQSGWNVGGPPVPAEDAVKRLVFARLQVAGPTTLAKKLPEPERMDDFYRDQFVVAFRINPRSAAAGAKRRPLENWQQKAMHRTLHFSAPDTMPLLSDVAPEPGEEDAHSAEVVDLTARMGRDGLLQWDVPPGKWEILRFGCTVTRHGRVSTSSDGWKGYALDVFDPGALRRYWQAVVEPLLADAGPLAGRALKYLHTDSWEVEPINWTPSFVSEFKRRRGYDLLPFAPVLAGRIVDSRDKSNRFLHDFRKTLGDLAIDNHYRIFKQEAHRHGLQIHPESGGPHCVPIDAQRCLGYDDVPMSEFWAWSWRHRVGDTNRFFVKQPASAAHTYGRRLVAAEGFTTIGPHWQETLWDNLKPAFDKACCEGLNLLVWHAFVCSPAEMGIPGIQYFAGTHLNPNVTWWDKSGPFMAYINRCQFMLQQGLFVADACYYYGDHVPNFAQLKQSDPARVLPGYDYDVITEEAILTRLECRGGRLVLPDGMSYRILVLPNQPAISLAVMQKVHQLIGAGATVVGPRPAAASGLSGYPQSDTEVKRLAGVARETAASRGRLIVDRAPREVLEILGVAPDFSFVAPDPQPALDYIHRRSGDAEIYFVANREPSDAKAVCTFRVTGKTPELWNPVTGERRRAAAFAQAGALTTVPLQFAPCGSWFVVFRQPGRASGDAATNFAKFDPVRELPGPWTVRFDPRWGGPKTAEFKELVSWTRRDEPGIKYYSGTATYQTQFQANGNRDLWLDLGRVRELAEVRLNGRSMGILWAPPFRVDISSAVRPGVNRLEIEVVNFWPNRIIGDQSLAPENRLTRTNIRKLTKDTPLVESGLMGPVQLLTTRSQP